MPKRTHQPAPPRESFGAAGARRQKRAKARREANEHRAQHNRQLRAELKLTAWELAQAARRERRRCVQGKAARAA